MGWSRSRNWKRPEGLDRRLEPSQLEPSLKAGPKAEADSGSRTELKGWAEGWSRVRGWYQADELDQRLEPDQELEPRQVSGPRNRKQGREVRKTESQWLGVHARMLKQSGTEDVDRSGLNSSQITIGCRYVEQGTEMR